MDGKGSCPGPPPTHVNLSAFGVHTDPASPPEASGPDPLGRVVDQHTGSGSVIELQIKG